MTIIAKLVLAASLLFKLLVDYPQFPLHICHCKIIVILVLVVAERAQRMQATSAIACSNAMTSCMRCVMTVRLLPAPPSSTPTSVMNLRYALSTCTSQPTHAHISVMLQTKSNYAASQKHGTKLFSISSSDIDRFSKFFHWKCARDWSPKFPRHTIVWTRRAAYC